MVQMLNEKPKLQQLTVKPFTIGGYEIRPCEYGAYCVLTKEEKEMKETNLQHYKEELKAIFNEHYEEPSKIIREIEALIGVEIKGYGFQSCTDAILIWMAQPYKKSILDDVEKEYLSAVIKPFRSRVKYIVKTYGVSEARQFIRIIMCDGEYSNLPFFKGGTMYKDMKVDKQYTLQELGLWNRLSAQWEVSIWEMKKS